MFLIILSQLSQIFTHKIYAFAEHKHKTRITFKYAKCLVLI